MKALLICLSIFVVDGDTIHCRTEGENIKVRIAALDCDELPSASGTRAKHALESLLAGRTVSLEPRGRDKYGRTVGRVLAGPLDVTAAMIRSGVCTEYCRYSRNEYGTCK